MAVNISYMGTKKELAPVVGQVIRDCQSGILLDAFAGMCSVGEVVAPRRQVWSNDTQVFAAEVGRALFTSTDEPPNVLRTADLHFEAFQRHRQDLEKCCPRSLEAERNLLDSPNFRVFSRRRTILSRALSLDLARIQRGRYNLFSGTYSDSYFGLHQAIEVDAIVYAIRSSHMAGLVTIDQKRWLTIGLARALLKISNSTGHFAQFLKPKTSSYERYLRQRRRNPWTDWLYSVGELAATGTLDWRRKNKSFHQDSLLLLPKLLKLKTRPSVIYADPPYTDDQYSRFYHLLDTLMLYDFPKVSGAGLYRGERFQTPFSLKSKAVSAFDSLVSAAARTGADFVLSYPSNGLIHEVGVDPGDLLRRYFRHVECCYSLPYSHSTFGASKGAARASVTELVYRAKS